MSYPQIIVRRNSKGRRGAYSTSGFSQRKGTDNASDGDSQGNEEL